MRYPALRIVIVLQYVMAVLAGVLVLIAARLARDPIYAAVYYLAGAVVIIALIAFAELLRVLIHIEANTRAALAPRASDPAPSAPAPHPETPREATTPRDRTMEKVIVAAAAALLVTLVLVGSL